MKRYVDGIGYTDVQAIERNELPQNAVYFGFDDRFMYYVVPDADTVFMVDDHVINELDEDGEDDAFERYFDAVKADVAYCLGIEEYSDEWYELMDI